MKIPVELAMDKQYQVDTIGKLHTFNREQVEMLIESTWADAVVVALNHKKQKKAKNANR